MRCFSVIYITLLLLLGGCYDSHNNKAPHTQNIVANSTLAELRQLCKGGYYAVTSELICVAQVTTSDREGNFYRSMFVEDGTGGAEIKLGIYDIESQYPIGLPIAIRLKGTAIMESNGYITIGLPMQSFDSSPREFESQVVIDKHITRGKEVQNINPLLCDIQSLNTSLCGRFVKITSVNHAPLAEDDGELTLEGYHCFIDNNGSAIFTRVSSYADFATTEIPTTAVAIQGILSYEAVGNGFGKQFVIIPRFKDDISTTNSAY